MKSDTPILETPQSISVVTRQQMDDQAAQTVSQALRYTPGILSEATGVNNRVDTIVARGFQPDQYLDGLKLYNGGYLAVDPWSLDRVEYVRGPASVLYGQISPGGLINMVSKRPTSDPYHLVEFQFGSYGRMQTAFDFSGPLNKDGTLLYRLDGLARRNGTQIEFDRDERVLLNPSITWRLDADTSLTILSGYQHNPRNSTFQQLPNIGTIFPTPFGKIPRNLYVSDPTFDRDESTFAHVGYSFEHRFNEYLKYTSNFRYAYSDRDQRYLYPYTSADFTKLDRYSQALNNQTNTLTADNRVQADFGTGALAHTVIAGIDYQNLKLRGREAYGNDNFPLDVFNPRYGVNVPVPAWVADTHQTLEQVGVYAQDSIKLDRLRIVGGIRQDWANSQTYDPLNPGPVAKQNDSAFTYRVGALYLFDNGLAPYVSYATSFQPLVNIDPNSNPFKPTTGQQAEVGLKVQPVGHDSFYTVSLYDLMQQNVLTPDPNGNNLRQVQIGEVKSKGVEFEAHTNFNKQLSLITSYAYQNVVNTRDAFGFVGKTPVRVPRQTASLWANYKFTDASLAGLQLGGGVRYVGEQFGDAQNDYKVPDFTLFDARISYDLAYLSPGLKGATAAVNVTNLFDKTYVAACIYADGGCYYGQGRMVYGTLTYKW